MRLVWVAVLAACGSDGPPLSVTTAFPVTTYHPDRPSPLDPLAGQMIAIEIDWPKIDYNHGDPATEPTGCKSIYAGILASKRTASGATAELVQSQILDRLPDWDVHFQICDASAGHSTVIAEAVIDELNLTFGCFGVPAAALQTDDQGYPELTSFTATQCSATILDVVNNCVIGNDNFELTIATSAEHVP
jgi:hypothetical protein